MLQIAVIGTIAIGLVFVLLLGEMDLSIGSVAGVTSAVLGVLMVHHGWPWWAAIIAAGAAGAAIGAFQGAWLAIVGVPSFVVTLAGLLSWQGVQVHVLGASGAVNVFDSHISWFATSYAARWVGRRGGGGRHVRVAAQIDPAGTGAGRPPRPARGGDGRADRRRDPHPGRCSDRREQLPAARRSARYAVCWGLVAEELAEGEPDEHRPRPSA